MWGLGGRYYWGRREGGKVEGIVVVFAWMSSQERHLKNYVDLYSSLGWNSLVCHSQFLNLFFPDKATSLAFEILKELVEELKIRPCPVVFASFSGGPKACMYKVLQIIEGKCEAQFNPDEYQLVRDCVSGHIYDSGPVDFTSDLGTRFVLHPTVLKMSHPPRPVTWVANGIASSLDTLFLSRFESQRAEYWQTLYSSVSMGAPYLILCSEVDDLAPYQVICNFTQRLQELGGDVKLVKWSSSPHVGHYQQYPIEYKGAVTELLGKASVVYSHRIRRLEGVGMGLDGPQDEISEPFYQLKKDVINSNKNFQRVALELNDHFFLPTSVEYHEDRVVGSVQDEHKEGLFHLPNPPSINAHGVLGQILFDACVPKNVEGWDVRLSPSVHRPPFASSRRHSNFNPIKCILRSRL
ncbi:Protein translocase subunit SecA like [Actinidia chinensis var. chinensis]|uniref:Protein translocase subunit SecA like n=1 Tax=Actinidia chinensis var. chinensis TaxID=1590841 RepID=A0A2R6RMZ8_ACTCC|nr:Protein translocase subunit SecA like [Actinidia chinensis var. chinensis]